MIALRRAMVVSIDTGTDRLIKDTQWANYYTEWTIPRSKYAIAIYSGTLKQSNTIGKIDMELFPTSEIVLCSNNT